MSTFLSAFLSTFLSTFSFEHFFERFFEYFLEYFSSIKPYLKTEGFVENVQMNGKNMNKVVKEI